MLPTGSGGPLPLQLVASARRTLRAFARGRVVFAERCWRRLPGSPWLPRSHGASAQSPLCRNLRAKPARCGSSEWGGLGWLLGRLGPLQAFFCGKATSVRRLLELAAAAPPLLRERRRRTTTTACRSPLRQSARSWMSRRSPCSCSLCHTRPVSFEAGMLLFTQVAACLRWHRLPRVAELSCIRGPREEAAGPAAAASGTASSSKGPTASSETPTAGPAKAPANALGSGSASAWGAEAGERRHAGSASRQAASDGLLGEQASGQGREGCDSARPGHVTAAETRRNHNCEGSWAHAISHARSPRPRGSYSDRAEVRLPRGAGGLHRRLRAAGAQCPSGSAHEVLA